MAENLKVGDHVKCIADGGKVGIRTGNKYVIDEIRYDGLVHLEGGTGYYYAYRFELDPAYAPAMPKTAGQGQLPAGGLGQALNGGSIPQGWSPPVPGPLSGAGNYGSPSIQTQQAQSASGPDPAKPYPDPEAEHEKSAEEKLREYRKSVRDFIGGY